MSFSYHRPATLTEALELSAQLGADAAYLGGGTELIPDFRRGRETARHLIALGTIPELRGITVTGDTLRIGALTPVAEVAASHTVREWLLAFAEAARSLGSPQIRTLATVGGNFCRAVACADLPPAAIAGTARVRLVSSAGEREVDAGDFFVGSRQTVLAAGEVLADVLIARPRAGFGSSYQRFANRQGMALAVASVAAGVVMRDGVVTNARVALGAVGPAPIVVDAEGILRGRPPTEELLDRAAAACAQAAKPITDIRGSAEYRRDIVEVLARRGLETAIERARA